MSYYWVGDKPVESLVFVPTKRGQAIDLELFHGVAAIHVQPNGNSTLVSGQVHINDGAVEIQFEGDSWFTLPGLHQLRVTLETADGRHERLDAIQMVVQDDDGWHTLPSARSEWQDAPSGKDGDDMRLYVLLELAKTAVLAYAPDLEPGQLPPLEYRHAQLLQARNIFNSSRVDPASGDAGGDGFALTPFPLDWTVTQLLRPKSPRPVAL